MTMIRVKLFTEAGRYVGACDVPPFNRAPDVIFWGERTFVLRPGQPKGEEIEYEEAFVWGAPRLIDEVTGA
jgi:hypothetical protein